MSDTHSCKPAAFTHVPAVTESFYGGEECLRRVKAKAVGRVMAKFLETATLADVTALSDALEIVLTDTEPAGSAPFINAFLSAVGFSRCDK